MANALQRAEQQRQCGMIVLQQEGVVGKCAADIAKPAGTRSAQAPPCSTHARPCRTARIPDGGVESDVDGTRMRHGVAAVPERPEETHVHPRRRARCATCHHPP